jgi:CitMHS family citrate-Mg2+:H+ or citrate-Ca2+:H+ symporter
VDQHTALAVLGFAAIAVFLLAIRRISVLVALVLVPLVFGLLSLTVADVDLGRAMMDGVIKVAPVGIMIAFAVLFFGLMLDVGLFDSVIGATLRLSRGDPLRLAIGTALLTLFVALDGDGSATFLITLSALLPAYQRLGMSRLVLATIVGLACGVMNILPWGGPTTRMMAVLNADAEAAFLPVVPAMLGGMVFVVAMAAYMGLRERRRLGIAGPDPAAADSTRGVPVLLERPHRRTGWRFAFNLALTVALIAGLLYSVLPLATLFIIAYALALLVNFPAWEDQRERLSAHAGSALMVASMIFAAGILTGVLTGTKMIEAMAATLVSVIPDQFGSYLPLIVALTGVPLSLVFTPDAYYFGVLPVLAESAGRFGLDPLLVGHAAVLGHTTTGFPLSPLVASTFLLVEKSGVRFGEHQRHMFGWAFAATLVMTLIAWLTGAI